MSGQSLPGRPDGPVSPAWLLLTSSGPASLDISACNLAARWGRGKEAERRRKRGAKHGFQTHPQNLFRECSVYCELVGKPEQMPRVLEIAMRTALARGGVGVVVIPGEVFFADVPSGAKAVPVRAAASVIRPDDSSLAAAAEVPVDRQRGLQQHSQCRRRALYVLGDGVHR